MGKFAVVDHAGEKITLSMVKLGVMKRMLLRLAKKFRMVDRYEFALFSPRYELAVFDGPSIVLSPMPHFIFYYPDTDTATRKWNELTAAVELGGLCGGQFIDFIRNADPREQGVNAIGVKKAVNHFFREAYGE
jgi:hypothetical protein